MEGRNTRVKMNFRNGFKPLWLLVLPLLLLVALVPSAPAYAGSMTKAWVPLGAVGFSSGEASNISMAVDGSGVPYVAYADAANGNKLSVKKYTSSGWTIVGSEGISAGAATDISLVFKDNNPYVLYIEDPCKVMLKQNVSGNWQGGQVATAEHAAISVCNHNYLYITATTTKVSGTSPYYSYRYVSTNGSTMTLTGSSGSTYAGNNFNNPAVASDSAGWGYFSDGTMIRALTMSVCGNNTLTGTNGNPLLRHYSITPGSTGGVYVAGKDYSGKADVQYIDEYSLHNISYFSSYFTDLGGSDGSADYISFKLNSSNIPYLAYSDGTSNGKATVRKRDGVWQDLGTKGFSIGTAKYISLALLDSTTPCIAFQDGATGNKASVYYYTDAYTVTFNSNGGTSESTQYALSSGKIQAPPMPQKTGYTFVNWCSDTELTTPFDFDTPITDNITLYAKWNINSYNVCFNTNEGSSVNSQTVDYNTTAIRPTPDPTRTGYTFAGWYNDTGLTASFNFATAITADTTLYAKWTINGSISGTVRDGTAAIAQATVSVSVNGTFYLASTGSDGSYTIAGVPAGTGYTITAGQSGGNSGSVGGITVTSGVTKSGVDINISCPITYRGVQKRVNSGTSTTYDVRFLATIDTLDPDEVGFVFSESETAPTTENVPASQVISTTVVYISILAKGEPVLATALHGTYIIACTVIGITEADVGTPLYMRAFARKGSATTYTPVKTIKVSDISL